MTVDEQIYFACAAYPMLYHSRSAVLNHLFLVNGNGYEWHNGQLVDPEMEGLSLKRQIRRVWRNRRRYELLCRRQERKRKREAERSPDPSVSTFVERVVAAVKAEQGRDSEGFAARQRAAKRKLAQLRRQQRRDDLVEYCIPPDIDKRLHRRKFSHWYPICEYADIMHLPNDVQPDWLQAAKEVIALVRRFPAEDPEEHARNLVWLTLAEIRIRELKVGRIR